MDWSILFLIRCHELVHLSSAEVVCNIHMFETWNHRLLFTEQVLGAHLVIDLYNNQSILIVTRRTVFLFYQCSSASVVRPHCSAENVVLPIQSLRILMILSGYDTEFNEYIPDPSNATHKQMVNDGLVLMKGTKHDRGVFHLLMYEVCMVVITVVHN